MSKEVRRVNLKEEVEKPTGACLRDEEARVKKRKHLSK